MEVLFSVNLRDDEGDAYDKCILLHVGDVVILKFAHIEELEDFIERSKKCAAEIKENWL